MVALLENGFTLEQVEAMYDCRDSAEYGLSIKLLAEFCSWFGITEYEELQAVISEITANGGEVVGALAASKRWYPEYIQSKAVRAVLNAGKDNGEHEVSVAIDLIVSSQYQFLEGGDQGGDQDTDLEDLFTSLLEKGSS